ncbi:MAG: hypothetical protein OXN17_16755 [Candidatus Poribacteria bacterium]|nr:hypothetical protein [Candidatus Poribacteria bacterium]MDE0505741.1 hypothetical protein [Candidatus Poribacteria bacterium]
MTRMLSVKQQHRIQHRVRRRSAMLFSLIIHMLIAIIFLYLHKDKAAEFTDSIAIDWVKDVPAPQLRKLKMKPPLKAEVFKPETRLAREAKNKLAESSPNKITEVARLSERIVVENLEVHEAPPSDKIPDLMTDADLRTAEASNLNRLVSQPGRSDGRGVVTGRVRVRGRGMGRFLTDSYGDSEDGLLGGGGNPGMMDPLGIVDFIKEKVSGNPQRVIYCLDVSASMNIPGLRKLELAIQSIKESLRTLTEESYFDIITFSAKAKSRKQELVPATAENITEASRYLEGFNSDRILGNRETNLLGAIEKALEKNPSVIVLVTDGLPTAGANRQRRLFSLDLKYQTHLNKNRIAILNGVFQNNGISISPNAVLIMETKDLQWKVMSGERTFYIHKELGQLNVYRKGKMNIETDNDKILEAVKAKNVNNTSIYVVGLEIVLGQSIGAELLVQLAEQNNGRFTLLDNKQLQKYAVKDKRGMN